ncbi:MAG: YsnF/AvaK domain-containing protein [Janthinobacterium lividum]
MSALPADQTPHSSLADESAVPLVIPVIEETASVTRELVETGRVRLTKTVTEEQHTLPLDLRHEQVEVRRVPVNQFLPDEAPAPDSRREGDTLIIPVLREVMVKRLLLVEELHVTTRQHVAAAPQTVMLRQEQVAVERLPPVSP